MPPKPATKSSSSAAASTSTSTTSKPVKSAVPKAKAAANGSTGGGGTGSDGGSKASTSKAAGSKKASTSSKPSTSTSAPSKPAKPLADVKMSAMEQAIHRHVLDMPKKTITQSDVKQVEGLPDDQEKVTAIINGMLRKQLLRLIRTPRGESGFVANSVQEAKELGSMTTSEKMCLEYISSTTNLGMWTRTLKAKTNLHQNVINRAIKVLEQKKLIKLVKSVKHPTRKIYMLASMIPSIDVTGGPWYTAKGELDTEFIGILQRAAKNYIRSKSFPQGRPELMWPRGYIPYLPTANDILEMLIEKDILREVQLDVEHIEAILNVLVYDGDIERIWCRRYDADGRHFEMETASISESTIANGSKKRKKKGAVNGKSKRARRDSADIDKDSDEDDEADDDDEEEDEEQDPESSEADDDFELPPRLGATKGNSTSSFIMNGDEEEEKPHQRPGPAGNQWYWVYRTLLTAIPSSSTKTADGETVHTYPEIYEVGITQTPCGICPVAQFCYNRGQPKVLPLPGEKDLADSGSTGWEEWKTSSSVTQRAKKAGKDAANTGDRMKALLKMKVPAGGGEFEDADGKWKGGGKVGGKVIAPVNPSNCRYYSQWFGEELEW